jgi:hypothetical protein
MQIAKLIFYYFSNEIIDSLGKKVGFIKVLDLSSGIYSPFDRQNNETGISRA